MLEVSPEQLLGLYAKKDIELVATREIVAALENEKTQLLKTVEDIKEAKEALEDKIETLEEKIKALEKGAQKPKKKAKK